MDWLLFLAYIFWKEGKRREEEIKRQKAKARLQRKRLAIKLQRMRRKR